MFTKSFSSTFSFCKSNKTSTGSFLVVASQKLSSSIFVFDGWVKVFLTLMGKSFCLIIIGASSSYIVVERMTSLCNTISSSLSVINWCAFCLMYSLASFATFSVFVLWMNSEGHKSLAYLWRKLFQICECFIFFGFFLRIRVHFGRFIRWFWLH